MLLTINRSFGDSNCSIATNNGLQIANCSHLGWSEVPSGLSNVTKVDYSLSAVSTDKRVVVLMGIIRSVDMKTIKHSSQ